MLFNTFLKADVSLDSASSWSKLYVSSHGFLSFSVLCVEARSNVAPGTRDTVQKTQDARTRGTSLLHPLHHLFLDLVPERRPGGRGASHAFSMQGVVAKEKVQLKMRVSRYTLATCMSNWASSRGWEKRDMCVSPQLLWWARDYSTATTRTLSR